MLGVLAGLGGLGGLVSRGLRRGLRRARRGGGARRFALGRSLHDDLTDLDLIAGGDQDLGDLAGQRRRQRDHGFVGLQLEQGLIGLSIPEEFGGAGMLME